MWTMWSAPSDRDYYQQQQPEEPEVNDGIICPQCGQDTRLQFHRNENTGIVWVQCPCGYGWDQTNEND